VQGQSQRVHQEQGRLCPLAPLLPKRPQRDLQGSPSRRMQARHQK
jgi:hypothetical protein